MKNATLLMATSTLFNVAAQLCYKSAAPAFAFTLAGTLGNPLLIAGLALYACSALLVIIALRYGELSASYPVIALTFVWVLLSSWLILHEHISLLNIIGILCIGTGVLLLGRKGVVASTP